MHCQTGVQVWKLYNTGCMDFHLFFCCANVRRLASLLPEEERQSIKPLWQVTIHLSVPWHHIAGSKKFEQGEQSTSCSRHPAFSQGCCTQSFLMRKPEDGKSFVPQSSLLFNDFHQNHITGHAPKLLCRRRMTAGRSISMCT